MILQVEAGGRTRAVEVRSAGGRFLVLLDGREHSVDVNEIGANWSLILGTTSYEIAFVERPGGAMTVQVNGVSIEVSIAAPPTWNTRARIAIAAEGAAGPQRIVAPMPGKIVKVLVAPGDPVEPRQGLIVVEAMKMENELRSARAGTVAEVLVKEGASVEAGAILVVVQ